MAERAAGLTPRERQIAGMVAEGLTNKEIAWDLGIADQTVKNHMSTIMRRLHMRKRTQVGIWAYIQEAKGVGNER